MFQAKFAYYEAPFEDIPATPIYLILKTDTPQLPVRGNVSDETLIKYGRPIPMTPTYRTWLKMGSPVCRG